MITLDPKQLTTVQMQAYLQGAVSPRPIALASTMDAGGQVNLSPFSFFNLFSSNPPVLIFSPSRRVRDNTTKHTLENVLEVPEVVIHVVTYAMVQQASLSSTEYPKEVNEFVKAGFTPVPSVIVRPPRVKESPVAFECKVSQVIPLGNEGGAGNLVICEVLLMHINDSILDEKGVIDPQRIDAVARMGGDWYCRASGQAVFKVLKPLTTLGIGVDRLPEFVRNSRWLDGNDLGMLANVERIPEGYDLSHVMGNAECEEAMGAGREAVHRLASQYLKAGRVHDAWSLLLAFE